MCERDAERAADDEAGQRAQQARAGVDIELARAERRDEVLEDLDRREHIVRQPEQRRELPEKQDGDQQAGAGESLHRAKLQMRRDTWKRTASARGTSAAASNSLGAHG